MKLLEHREIWQRKPVLRAIYADFYKRIAEACAAGPTLEVGGGTGNLKTFRDDIVASDVQFAAWLDVVADAQRLPFATGAFANIVLFDVLHHLERPCRFLKEAERVLMPGGRVILVEPAITPLSYLFYRYLHPEPVSLAADPLADGPLSQDRDPYDANQAIPTLLFGRYRARLETLVGGLRLVRLAHFSLFAYPLSGGFRPWSLLPGLLVGPLLRLEALIEPLVGRLVGFRLLAVLERQPCGAEAGPSASASPSGSMPTDGTHPLAESNHQPVDSVD